MVAGVRGGGRRAHDGLDGRASLTVVDVAHVQSQDHVDVGLAFDVSGRPKSGGSARSEAADADVAAKGERKIFVHSSVEGIEQAFFGGIRGGERVSDGREVLQLKLHQRTGSGHFESSPSSWEQSHPH